MSYWQNKGIVSRFGGDEFVALCYGAQAELEQDLQNMQFSLQQNTELCLGFSFGIALFESDWSKSFKQADHAMYEHKRAKKIALKASEAFTDTVDNITEQ